jgi:hypothetical protein
MKKVSITHVNNEHNRWLRSMDFYKGEIGVLKEFLTEIAGKNTVVEVMAQVEHYENQFTVQLDNIKRLKHDIRANITIIAKEAEASKAGYIEDTLLTQHTQLGNNFDDLAYIITDLINSFRKFEGEWM